MVLNGPDGFAKILKNSIQKLLRQKLSNFAVVLMENSLLTK